MAYKETNWRTLLKSTTTAGVVPTIPSSAATSLYDHTLGGWLATDIYSTELFANETDKKIWCRLGDTNVLLGYSGQTTDFVDLGDVPNTFVGSSGYYVTVNSAETALVFTALPTIYDRIANMTDFVGTTGTGSTGYAVTLDASGTGFTLSTVNTSYIKLTDVTQTGYTGFGNYIVQVNTAETALEFVDGSTKFIDLSTTQIIGGDKEFSSAVTFVGIASFTNGFNFTGLSNSVYIWDIDTSGMTSVNDNTLATTKSIYDYINTIVFSTGDTSSFVTIATNQTVTGAKTFTSPSMFFTSGLTSKGATFTDNVVVSSGNVQLKINSQFIIGNETLDGSYKFFINPSGDLEVQKRVAGTWTMASIFNV